MKYYISRDVQFVQGAGNLVTNPSSATHFKHAEAQRFVAIHPDHEIMIVRSNSKNKSYIISTKQAYLGDEDSIEKNMAKAKVFSSAKEAYDYLDSHPVANELLGAPLVIDEKYRRIKREVPVITAPVITAPKQVQENCERIQFSKSDRKKLLNKYSYICPLCNKAILEGEETIDHIIPISRGGSNDISNLRPVHEKCNMLKGNLLDGEMMELINDISCNHAYTSPESDISKKYIRSYVRGFLRSYNVKGFNCN